MPARMGSFGRMDFSIIEFAATVRFRRRQLTFGIIPFGLGLSMKLMIGRMCFAGAVELDRKFDALSQGVCSCTTACLETAPYLGKSYR